MEKLTETISSASDQKGEWKQVGTFGNGIIYTKGDERKIVTPGFADFEYRVKPVSEQ